MTLTQPQRVSLARLLEHLRSDWHNAGIHSAVVVLAASERTAFELCQQAIQRASVAAHRTPECINFAETFGPVPLEQDECRAHGGRTHRADGSFVCCWLEDRADRTEPYRRATPPRTDEDRARTIAVAFPARRPVVTPQSGSPVEGGNPSDVGVGR